jgi:hypothetical protein
MNQITAGFGTRTAAPVPAPSLSTRTPSLGLDPSRLREAILAKRAEIARLELEWSTTSERAAARAAGGAARLGERETWDRATWDRYLSTAADCQESFMPRLRRLYAEVSRLETLAEPMSFRRRAVA